MAGVYRWETLTHHVVAKQGGSHEFVEMNLVVCRVAEGEAGESEGRVGLDGGSVDA